MKKFSSPCILIKQNLDYPMKYFLVLIICFFTNLSYSQNDEDGIMIKKIHDHSLSSSMCYEWLRDLCKKAGPRLAGSQAYDRAVALTTEQLKSVKGLKVYTQKTTAVKWDRGKDECHLQIGNQKKKKIDMLLLGNSVGTDGKTITGDIIEVKSLDEVDKMSEKDLKGKVVFYNRKMDETKIRTFSAYGGAADQRVAGASKAAEKGAIAVIVRSLTTENDNEPHTGTLSYKEAVTKIPGIAISTNQANQLSNALKNEKVTLHFKSTAKIIGETSSDNVIAEITGSQHPESIILIGGHLDAWDVGEGAHDDGAGCVQSMEVLNTFINLSYQPKYTIRCVLFANEENGLSGGKTYAKNAIDKKEFHLAAIESDAGGFSPRGFSFDADTSVLKKFYKRVSDKFLPYLESYGLSFELGGSGADISPLKPLKGLLIGLRPDSQRYFDFHHTRRDKFEAVHPRELRLGAASMTSLVYLIDKYGLN